MCINKMTKIYNSIVKTPPFKIQGIKTKLIPCIYELVKHNSYDCWIEPFMGSGVVAFNIRPKKAILCDSNPYIIEFYNSIKNKTIDDLIVREFLETEGEKLSELDDVYYYKIRERFNHDHMPLDFLFLNRSCFNGMIRFNRNGEFNVPYGHKPKRFSKAYITKICNQVKYVQQIIIENDYKFVCQDFTETIKYANKNSIVYCDPPYIGRHVDYYDSWNEENEIRLHDSLKKSSTRFILSTWDKTKFRENEYIRKIWNAYNIKTTEHFYFVGAKEINRNSVTEALIYNF